MESRSLLLIASSALAATATSAACTGAPTASALTATASTLTATASGAISATPLFATLAAFRDHFDCRVRFGRGEKTISIAVDRGEEKGIRGTGFLTGEFAIAVGIFG